MSGAGRVAQEQSEQLQFSPVKGEPLDSTVAIKAGMLPKGRKPYTGVQETLPGPAGSLADNKAAGSVQSQGQCVPSLEMSPHEAV